MRARSGVPHLWHGLWIGISDAMSTTLTGDEPHALVAFLPGTLSGRAGRPGVAADQGQRPGPPATLTHPGSPTSPRRFPRGGSPWRQRPATSVGTGPSKVPSPTIGTASAATRCRSCSTRAAALSARRRWSRFGPAPAWSTPAASTATRPRSHQRLPIRLLAHLGHFNLMQHGRREL